jgi:putative hemolysin
MTLWTQVTQPVVALLEGLARAILALLGAAEREEQQVTEAELRMMIGLSAETGTIVEEEAELLTRVFHFGDRQVHEVLVPRSETVWLPRGMTVRDFYKVFAETPHSRFPMYEGDLDHVIGIIGIKDVLRAIALGEMKEDDPVERVLRPAFFVPETKVIAELFREMQAQGHQMAIAVDEWGGTAGIVTIELLLEEMVGRVRDELLPPEEEEIKTIDAGVLEVDGSLSVEEAREELGIDIPEGPYDTVAGFVLSVLGHIPREGEFVILDGHQITVTEMKGLKIESLRITRV